MHSNPIRRWFQWSAHNQPLWLACTLLVGMVILGGYITRPPTVPDFSAYDNAQLKKAAFFDYLAPFADSVNARVLTDQQKARELLQSVAAGRSLGWLERAELARLSALYLEADKTYAQDEALQTIIRRADKVPTPLVLIQAAKESGWGTSRFAIQAFNFFGQRCYQPGCGIKPKRRATGARFQVARFQSPQDSVRAYIHNLNTHPRYREFRHLRQQMRSSSNDLDPLSLADGLHAYSERGQDYVDDIKSMLRNSGW